MTTPIPVSLISLAIQILLLPLVVLVLPLAFAIAWVCEAIVDLARRGDHMAPSA